MLAGRVLDLSLLRVGSSQFGEPSHPKICQSTPQLFSTLSTSLSNTCFCRSCLQLLRTPHPPARNKEKGISIAAQMTCPPPNSHIGSSTWTSDCCLKSNCPWRLGTPVNSAREIDPRSIGVAEIHNIFVTLMCACSQTEP